MSSLRHLQDAKIEMVQSLAHSQHAMFRILDSIADLSTASEPVARALQENIALLTTYQSAMCRMLTGLTIHHLQHGTPASPWLHPAIERDLRITGGLSNDHKQQQV